MRTLVGCQPWRCFKMATNLQGSCTWLVRSCAFDDRQLHLVYSLERLAGVVTPPNCILAANISVQDRTRTAVPTCCTTCSINLQSRAGMSSCVLLPCLTYLLQVPASNTVNVLYPTEVSKHVIPRFEGRCATLLSTVAKLCGCIVLCCPKNMSDM